VNDADEFVDVSFAGTAAACDTAFPIGVDGRVLEEESEPPQPDNAANTQATRAARRQLVVIFLPTPDSPLETAGAAPIGIAPSSDRRSRRSSTGNRPKRATRHRAGRPRRACDLKVAYF
jgi:hypothetical protein